MAHSQGAQDVGAYEAKDTIGETIKGTLITGGMGLFVSAIMNSLTKQNVGAFSVFSRTGSLAAMFAGAGGAYSFVKNSSANLREIDDTWNYTYGGAAAGAILGLRLRTIPASLGYAVVTATVVSAFNYTGASLSGYKRDPSVDEVSRKEFLRKNRRRPIEQTLNEIGEGRGITGPGYEERRAQRIKERYGIDVPLSS